MYNADKVARMLTYDHIIWLYKCVYTKLRRKKEGYRYDVRNPEIILILGFVETFYFHNEEPIIPI
jgi:hypothetical protein